MFKILFNMTESTFTIRLKQNQTRKLCGN